MSRANVTHIQGTSHFDFQYIRLKFYAMHRPYETTVLSCEASVTHSLLVKKVTNVVV